MPEPIYLDHYLACDCRGEQVCDKCQVLRPAFTTLQARVKELEAQVFDDNNTILDLRARVAELEARLAICRASLDHPVMCPRCETHFLPYIDPKEVRGITPEQLRQAIGPENAQEHTANTIRCPVCFQDVQLSEHGHLAHHTYDVAQGFAQTCRASGHHRFEVKDPNF